MDITDAVEIPVWYGGVEKWITGIHRRTTCEDVVRALVSSHHGAGDNNNNRKISENHRDYNNYVIVEKWRKIERVLDAKSKIQKLWSKWGEEQSNVKLSLKKIQQPQLKNVNKRHKASKSYQPKKVSVDGPPKMTETVDRLMKLIMSQTETISYQLNTLLDKDKKIEEYETQIHKLRMTQIGANYVQDAYLPDSNEKSKEEEKTPEKLDQDETEEATQIYQKILDLCLKLEKEENNAITLQAELKDEAEVGKANEKANDVKISKDIALATAELERLTALFRTHENVLCQNDKIIFDSERTLVEKHRSISQLEMDIEKADRETECLQREYQQLCVYSQNPDTTHRKSDYCVTNANLVIPSSIDTFPLSCRGETESLDSDTGLSSLHSSDNSEEGGYVLNTLV